MPYSVFSPVQNFEFMDKLFQSRVSKALGIISNKMVQRLLCYLIIQANICKPFTDCLAPILHNQWTLRRTRMITRNSSAVSVTLEKQNISEMFPPSLVLFQSYLFVRVYVGLKDKPVNIVRILVLYLCISRPCWTVYSSAALMFAITVDRRNLQLLTGFILNDRFSLLVSVN